MDAVSADQTLTIAEFRDEVCLRLKEPSQKHHAIWYLDINKFRFINEAYGYATGDVILATVARFLTEQLDGAGIFCRLNDDRFAVYSHEASSEEANETFERLYRAFNLALHEEGIGHPVEIAAGIYFLTPDDVKSPEISHLIDLANIAHRRAKLAGGSHLAIFDYEFFEKQQRENIIENSLADSIASGEIEVWMQPQLDYASGEIVGAEALSRWNHAQLGQLSPAEFIPVLERSGKIRDLDRYVWDVTCREAHFWHTETGTDPIPFSVNISRAEILDPDLANYFTNLVRTYKLPSDTLRLEVTESTYTEHPDELIAAVKALREAGFVVEMDDFGSGYSSLNMLRNLPVDVLKLDMGFLRGAAEEASDGVILNSVIRMAHGLDMPIIAEGVETLEQAEMLKTMGCRLMQGYYFSRPMPIDQFHSLLQKTKAKRHSFAWAQKSDGVNRLLDRNSDTSFFFNNCIGAAIIFNVIDGRMDAMLVNDALFDEMGINSEEVDLFRNDLLHYVRDTSRITLRKAVALAAEQGDARCTAQVDLNERWMECIIHAISRGEAGNVMIALVRDVTEEHALREGTPTVARASRSIEPERDPVTGLVTRNSLDALMQGELARTGGTYAVITIDNFDAYERLWGQEAAETLLERMASLMRSTLSREALLARYAEGAFATFVPRQLNSTDARAIACQLIDAVRATDLGHGHISVSIGVAQEPGNSPTDILHLYSHALQALYLVRLNGGDGFLHYNMISPDTSGETTAFATQLRHSPDGELLTPEALEGQDLFSIISRDFAEHRAWNSNEGETVRDTVFGALRYRSMAEVPGIMSFDYNPVDDVIFLESVDADGMTNQKMLEHFHEKLFSYGHHIASESMARLSSLLTDLEYLPAAGNVDLKCCLGDDDDFRWYRFSFTCLRDEKQFVIRGLGYGEDIDSSRESSAWWKDRAVHDGLTGLLNREGLEEAIELQLSRHAGGMMFMIDLDNFKAVNDQLGHLSGDSVLCSVADTLLCTFRDHDVVGRYGADEMIAFISGITSTDLAKTRAQRLLDEIADIEVGTFGHISASIGVAVMERAPEGFYDFLEVADHACYLSKQRGKNCFTVTQNGIIKHKVSKSAEGHHTQAGYKVIEEIIEHNREVKLRDPQQ